MLNGPCSDMYEGKCRVENYKTECVWVNFFKSLKRRNDLDQFLKINPPINWNKGESFLDKKGDESY